MEEAGLTWCWPTVAAFVAVIAAFAVAVLWENLDCYIPEHLPPAQEDVRWAYRNVLGREPDSRRSLKRLAKKRMNREELFAEFVRSEEFRMKPQAEQQRLWLQARTTILR